MTADEQILAVAKDEKIPAVPGSRTSAIQSADSRAWTQSGNVD